ncbi:MAG: transporter [Ferruginibacter sp.]|uniref:efflux RND transporter permease subunit n=1 Tax=Ferruginibacter sp. TaxID=1940288 RepID=UPI00265B1947|nr:MMPL family transporter [Ferruginibacter sp.]MDB5276935.1 transporter [Ferruginibacter sp.]
MWQGLAKFVLKYRLPLLIILFASTAVMGYFASKVTLSYEFAKAIPSDNPKYLDYVAFRQKFGDDGNLLVVAVQTDQIFELKTFQAYRHLEAELKKVKNVESVLSVPSSITLHKDESSEKLVAVKIFPDSIATQAELDSSKALFFSLPFYRTLLYNPETKAYLLGVRINKDSLSSPKRTRIVGDISKAVTAFESETKITTYISGLPLIRTLVSDMIKKEMRLFLIGSLVLSALILLVFFRSLSTMLLSLLVVLSGVIWSVGVLFLLGYKITLLTALTPPLIVVIGIPNCIYFINKYHTGFLASHDKMKSLVDMVSKMGVVTLFCNITAAIGFAVFALTRSSILKEFGVVAGISIMLIFVISFILLPAALSYLPAPKPVQTKYLHNRWITYLLLKIEQWVMNHKGVVFGITAVVLVVAIAGIFKLKTVAYIVDDLPKDNKIYTDLKFFEHNFKGVMPLEIMVDSKKRRGISGMRALTVFSKIDSLSQYVSGQKEMNRPLSIAEGLKFVKQAFYDGDSANYQLPNSSDIAFLGDYLKAGKGDSSNKNNVSNMLASFIDTAKQTTRISISMADVGTEKLPVLLNGIQQQTNQLFDSTQYKVTFTGSSITFLEGSRFIINGLKESIFYAFLLIAVCMLYLFRSARILVCSLIPNVIPLIITAGVMGWAGVPLKPSTVLIFSVALGIAIDITIRFLVNYKQELPLYDNDVQATVSATIKSTGLSIVYTSLVLIAGFVIFCMSSFGGTQSLGWLTSVTLFVATVTNLVLLPVLLLLMAPKKKLPVVTN